VDWIQWGYAGLFVASFLGASIVPLSSEPILMALIAAGADPIISLIVATTGNWLGGMSSYLIGRAGKWHWIERCFHTPHAKVLAWRGRITRFGPLLAAFSWVPFAGDAASLALGFFRAPIWPTAIWMLVGRFSRYLLVIWLMRLWEL